MLMEPEDGEHFGVPLDFIALLNHDAVLADALLSNPEQTLLLLQDAALAAQVRELCGEEEEGGGA